MLIKSSSDAAEIYETCFLLQCCHFATENQIELHCYLCYLLAYQSDVKTVHVTVVIMLLWHVCMHCLCAGCKASFG